MDKPPATASALANIHALIEGGGQIMVGTIRPIKNAAVAHDGQQTLAMLRRKPKESMQDLLARLDAAVATAKATGQRVDDINKASSDTRYELGRR